MALAIGANHSMGKELRDAIGVAGTKRRALALRGLQTRAEHLAARSLAEPNRRIDLPDRLQKPHDGDPIELGRENRIPKQLRAGGPRGEVVDLGRSVGLDQLPQAAFIEQVTHDDLHALAD